MASSKNQINKEHPRIKNRTLEDQKLRNSLAKDINSVRKLENLSSTTKDEVIYNIRQERSDALEMKERLKNRILNMMKKIPSDPTMVDKVKKLNEREKILTQKELVDAYIEVFNTVDLEDTVDKIDNHYLRNYDLLVDLWFKANFPKANANFLPIEKRKMNDYECEIYNNEAKEELKHKEKKYIDKYPINMTFLHSTDPNLNLKRIPQSVFYKGNFYFKRDFYKWFDILKIYSKAKDWWKAFLFNTGAAFECDDAHNCHILAKDAIIAATELAKWNNIAYILWEEHHGILYKESLITLTPFWAKVISISKHYPRDAHGNTIWSLSTTERNDDYYPTDISPFFNYRGDEEDEKDLAGVLEDNEPLKVKRLFLFLDNRYDDFKETENYIDLYFSDIDLTKYKTDFLKHLTKGKLSWYIRGREKMYLKIAPRFGISKNEIEK